MWFRIGGYNDRGMGGGRQGGGGFGNDMRGNRGNFGGGGGGGGFNHDGGNRDWNFRGERSDGPGASNRFGGGPRRPPNDRKFPEERFSQEPPPGNYRKMYR